MLDRSKSRFDRTLAGQPLLSTIGLSNLADGIGMIMAIENGGGVLRPGNGNANTLYAGFLNCIERVLPSVAAKVETVTATTTSATLSRAPNSTTDIRVYNLTSGAALTYTAGAGASGQFDVSGTTITLNAAQSGAKLLVTYKYNLTALELTMLYGHGFVGQSAIEALRAVDVVLSGEIYTDCFDASVDWSAIDTDASGEVLKIRANGLVSVNGNGAVIPNSYIIQVPNADSPFLGIRIN
jgi:hypothetical protein